jgi:TolB-like protein
MILDDDHRAVQDAVCGYVQDRIAPKAAAWDREAHFPKEELQGLAALGCYGVAVPTEYDGAGLDYLALAVILEEIAAGGTRADAGRENSIAVLPFENQSGPDDEYFADGVTDEILNALAQVDGLRVAARTSCFAFKGRREDLRLVGEKLDVATVLEGTVRRSGSRLRITAQMVHAADGYQLWSERYDREMTDVFEVQDEIARKIDEALRITL